MTTQYAEVLTAPEPLVGRNVVVVGGASGFGLGVAHAAAEAGARVSVISRAEDSVERALDRLPAGVEGHVISALDRPGLDAVFGRIGQVHHVAYTAADAPVTGPITTLPVDEVRRAFETRYFGALTVIGAVAPHLDPGGSITLTSGAAGVRPRATSGVLAGVCGAMEALARALAMELSPIRVNVVRPGFTRTGMWADLDEATREAMFRQTAETNLVGHVGEAAEVARAYIYCMTQTYATGSIIAVDGGYALV
ncbi:SDR family oxidoreductase [Pseudonocardia kujensis]|uniref:SDR family oxidoreductase n=1 Tax=Pseudonocardia kujensis TaxID=1128675 RepID=UPI001E2CB978|nr:SDR family oxidoreductase [Pseudonocardia kujensis]MCE0767609.1 SDR family oxidoreductase [Pseudonocardia kujensis]